MSLAFHRVRDWIQSPYNLSDMLSKHWDHPSVYPMILKLCISRGIITFIPEEVTQEMEKQNNMIEKNENKKHEKHENIKMKND